MTRRTLLATPAAYLQARRRVTREVFLRSPAKGTAVMAEAYYTAASGGAMVSIEHRYSRSDTVDVAYYRYSKDYGRTCGPPIERNTGERRPEGMLRRHPLPGVYTGKNMVMLGDVASVPIAWKDGSILLPAIVTTLDSDGKIYNPTGGYTYTDAIVLHGRWRGKRLTWRSSEVVQGDPGKC